MKKYSNRIIGVLLVIVLSISVFAFNMDVNAKKDKIVAHYGIKLVKVKKDVYKIEVNWNKAKKDAKEKTEFVITKFVGTADKDYKGTKFTDETEELNIKPLNGDIEIYFEISILGKNDKEGKRLKADPKTGMVGKKIYGDKYSIKSSSAIYNKYAQELSSILGQVNASKTKVHPDYQSAANMVPAKNKIGKAGSLSKTLTCNTSSSKHYYINDVKKGEYNKDTDYYANKIYYSTDRPGKTIKYTYKYSNGRKSKKVKVCTQHCKEVVKVEYGPPVASKGGLCFQYKFKVTSYVQCTATPSKKYPKESDYDACTPPPECYNAHLGLIRQGGPNEEYKQCIRECDGGKYSRNCSNKCYKKVYGKKNKVGNTNYRIDSANMLKVSDNSKDCPDSDGCYYWSGGSVYWKKKSEELGRWYSEWGKAHGKEYDPHDLAAGKYDIVNGIYVHEDCNDHCGWDTDLCSKDDYLNPKQAEEDMEKHLKGYIAALKECIAATKCTEKTSTYTIKVDYATKNTSGTRNFPSTDTDKLVSPNGVGNTNKNLNSTIISPGETVTEDTNSCYTPNSKFNWYQGEWTFPGSYHNAKTGELTYTHPGNLEGWIEKKNHYCLPLNAKEVNKQWWAWDQIAYSRSHEDYKGEAPNNNITGTTNTFGYYGWKFIMNCFYAVVDHELKDDSVSNNPPYINESEKTTSTSLNNYEVRVVDTAKLFASRTGDKIGFNWTTSSNMKGLEIDKMIDSITNNRQIYTDAYKDYSFHLTKENLAAIREYTNTKKNNEYTNYPGTIKVPKEVGSTYKISRYYSELLTRINQYATNPKILDRDAKISRYASYK